MTYQDKRQAMIDKAIARKAEAIQAMNESIKQIRTTQDIISNFGSYTIEETDRFVQYNAVKHPNCYSFSIVFMRKSYPFDIYQERSYYYNTIPQAHKANVEKLYQTMLAME